MGEAISSEGTRFNLGGEGGTDEVEWRKSKWQPNTPRAAVELTGGGVSALWVLYFLGVTNPVGGTTNIGSEVVLGSGVVAET